MNGSAQLLFLLALALSSTLTVCAQSQPAASARRSGAITGKVVAEDGSLVAGTRITVSPVGTGTQVNNRSIFADEEGNFTANNLEARSYRVTAYLPGYVTANEDDPLRVARVGDNVALNLTKGGVITGRVTDASGEPVIGVPVTISRVKDATGKPVTVTITLGATGSLSVTDDRGVYRIYGLVAGTYVVYTNTSNFAFSGSPYVGTVAVYHPSNTREGATEVQVQAGVEVSGIDIRYRMELGQSVSGKVSGSITNPNATNSVVGYGVNVYLMVPGTELPVSQAFVQTSSGQTTFELKGIANGDYDLKSFRAERDGVHAVSAVRRVSIRNADVGGVELALSALAAVKGKVVVEAASLKPEDQAACAKGRTGALYEVLMHAQTTALRKDAMVLPSYLMGRGAAVDENGDFIISGLEVGQYRLRPDLPGTNWYVKSVALQAAKPEAKTTTPADGGLFALKAGETLSGLTMTLAEGAAQLAGKVESKQSGRVRVHLIPVEATLANDVLRYDEALAKADGSFAFAHLAPGKYWLLTKPISTDEPEDRAKRLLAWDATARTALRKEAEAKAQTVELGVCSRIGDYKLRQ